MDPELVAFLEQQGCSSQEMAAAHARGRLFGLAGDRQILPVLGLVSLTEAAAHLEAPVAQLHRAWLALGIADAGLDAPVLAPSDLEALRTFLDAVPALGEEAVLGLLRVVGSALARVAEAEASAMRTGIAEVVLGDSELVTAQAYAAVASFVPRIGRLLDSVHRQHLMSAREHFERIEGSGGTTFTCAVGFADLSGFTRLSQTLELGELSRLLAMFEARATELVQARGGRVVKFLGDAVMWVAAGRDQHVAVGRDLVAASATIPVRVGLSYGPMLAQDGDWFGPPVNLAARLVAAAAPGQLLSSFAFDGAVPVAPLELKGLDEPVPAWTCT